MQSAYYITLFVISLVLSMIYIFRWRKHFDVNISMIFVLVTLVNLFYCLLYIDPDIEKAEAMIKLIYMSGCYLPFFITLCVFTLCGFDLKNYIRLILFVISSLMYSTTLTIGHTGLYYRDMRIVEEGGRVFFVKDYGPMHAVFYVVITAYFVMAVAVIIYSFFKQTEVSRRILLLLFIPELVSFLGYVSGHFLGVGIETMPLTYDLALAVYLFIVHRISLYSIGEMAIESLVQSGDTGFVSLDMNGHYLVSNDTAKNIFPALCRIRIDESLEDEEELRKTILHWVEHFKEDSSADKNMHVVRDSEDEDNDRMYIVSIDYLLDGNKKRGYQIFLTDDSQNQKYIKLLDKYNSELEEEVNQKTERIINMHNNLIMSMATMVESRDNSTGGHIKRTSAGVRLLIDEIKKENTLNLSDSFCRNIIKAAPMHDLGKIAVDDAILRKPGRFTDEEFEIMKKHAAEGARIVHDILKDTDDDEFKVIAENVAHYHHERWDGSGYPEHLKGEEIPLEARIMAIADVYDALVSKRVYKESMSFEEADKIIMESMGRHFDEGLKKYYIKARPKLEEYYSSQK